MAAKYVRRSPHIQTGYARSASESEYPQLWRGLQGAWPFGMQGGGRTIQDFSGRGHPGIFTGSGVSWAYSGDPNRSRVLYCDGTTSSYIVAASVFSSLTPPLTMSVWMNETSLGLRMIFMAASSNGDDHYGFADSNQSTQFMRFWSNDRFIAGARAESSLNSYGKWVHLCGVSRSDSNREIYLNGNLLNTNTTLVTPDEVTHVYIGSGVGLISGPMLGYIDEPYIFNRALSNSEIRLLYEVPYAPFVKRRRIYAVGGVGPTSLTPDAVAISLVVTTPTLSASVSFTPDPVAMPILVSSPTLVSGTSLAPNPVTIPIAVPDPALSIGGVSLAPDPVSMPLVIPIPSLSTPAADIEFQQSATGGSSGIGTVATATSLTAVANHLYLAAITTRPATTVGSISGLGLTWTQVDTQLGGRGTINCSVWFAQGTPSGDGVVTATLSASATSAAIGVSRYSGVDAADSIGAISSANTNGIEGAGSGGTDTNSYAFNVTTTEANSFLYSAVGIRNKTHTPGTGYTERYEHLEGDPESLASSTIVSQDKLVETAGSTDVSGTMSDVVDWAVVAVEILKGVGGTTNTITPSPITIPIVIPSPTLDFESVAPPIGTLAMMGVGV